MVTRIYLMLGGAVQADGPISGLFNSLSSGAMYQLRSLLQNIPGASVTTYQWSEYMQVAADIDQHKDDLTIIIGYSGGGSRATWLANLPDKPRIDLMVLYDPSPYWQMQPVGENVRRAISFQNRSPSWFFKYGAGELKGPHVETVLINMPHLLVQTSQNLHARTIAEIVKLQGQAKP